MPAVKFFSVLFFVKSINTSFASMQGRSLDIQILTPQSQPVGREGVMPRSNMVHYRLTINGQHQYIIIETGSTHIVLNVVKVCGRNWTGSNCLILVKHDAHLVANVHTIDLNDGQFLIAMRCRCFFYNNDAMSMFLAISFHRNRCDFF